MEIHINNYSQCLPYFNNINLCSGMSKDAVLVGVSKIQTHEKYADITIEFRITKRPKEYLNTKLTYNVSDDTSSISAKLTNTIPVEFRKAIEIALEEFCLFFHCVLRDYFISEIIVVDGSYHDVNSSGKVFRIATYICRALLNINLVTH